MTADNMVCQSLTPGHFEFVRKLRSHPQVQSGFLERTSITQDQQEAYMQQHAGKYIVATLNGLPAGYAGVIDGDIRVCTHPDFQGKGVGRALILEIVSRFPGSTARIKPHNEPSRRLFEACGFVHVGAAKGGLLLYRAAAED